MSTMSHDAIRLQPALARSGRPNSATFVVDELANPAVASDGYAFESAMCLVESQSPLLRPAFDAPASQASTTIEEHENRVLLSRTRLLTKLLAGVRGYLDVEEWRMLLDAAGRVASELTAAIGGRSDGGRPPRWLRRACSPKRSALLWTARAKGSVCWADRWSWCTRRSAWLGIAAFTPRRAVAMKSVRMAFLCKFPPAASRPGRKGSG